MHDPGSAVVVRCDAGPTLGVGHVMRCVALAEEWASRGREVVFVADLAEVPWARAQVESRGFRHVQPPAAVGQEVALVASLRPGFVVVDSYVLPEQVYAGLRGLGVPTMALVDGDPAGRPADVWLDQNIGAEDDAWPVPAGTTRLAGLDFALVRDDLRAGRPGAPVVEDTDVPRVFAFFGGTDAFGAAPVVASALAATGLPFHARVVGASEAATAGLRGVRLGEGQSLEVLAPSDRLAQEVLGADLVLSAAGTSSWELLCLGAAAGLVCVADNQVTSYQRAVDAGLVAGLGHLDALRQDAGPTTAVLRELLGSADRRAQLRRHAWQRVDGRGRARVVDVCEARSDRIATRP